MVGTSSAGWLVALLLNGQTPETPEAPPSKELLLYLAEYRKDQLDPLALEDSTLLEASAPAKTQLERAPQR